MIFFVVNAGGEEGVFFSYAINFIDAEVLYGILRIGSVLVPSVRSLHNDT